MRGPLYDQSKMAGTLDIRGSLKNKIGVYISDVW